MQANGVIAAMVLLQQNCCCSSMAVAAQQIQCINTVAALAALLWHTAAKALQQQCYHQCSNAPGCSVTIAAASLQQASKTAKLQQRNSPRSQATLTSLYCCCCRCMLLLLLLVAQAPSRPSLVPTSPQWLPAVPTAQWMHS
jgi:hypothetical protein